MAGKIADAMTAMDRQDAPELVCAIDELAALLRVARIFEPGAAALAPLKQARASEGLAVHHLRGASYHLNPGDEPHPLWHVAIHTLFVLTADAREEVRLRFRLANDSTAEELQQVGVAFLSILERALHDKQAGVTTVQSRLRLED
jgi:hypothetical protein